MKKRIGKKYLNICEICEALLPLFASTARRYCDKCCPPASKKAGSRLGDNRYWT